MRKAIVALAMLSAAACGGQAGAEPVHPVEIALGDSEAHPVTGSDVTVQLVRTTEVSGATLRPNQASVLVTKGSATRQITLRAPPGDGVPDSAVALGWRVQLLETVPSTRVRVWPEHGH